MHLLLNVSYNLFDEEQHGRHTGPMHFSSILINDLKKTKDKFTAIVFEKTGPQTKPYFKSRTVKKGRNSWLVLNVWIPTALIIDSKRKMNPGVQKVINQIKKALKTINPDVYFLNGFSALTFLIMRATYELKIPMVTTHHGLWFKEYLVLKRSLIKTPIKYRMELEKDTVRYAKKNIFLSNLSLSEMQKHLIKVPKSNQEFVKIPYNPVFLNKTYPKPNQKKPLKILMVGRWDAVKNHEAYLRLAKHAKKLKLPWKFYSVCNIGDYTHYNDIKDEYLKTIKVLPAVPAEKLKKIYTDSNIIVMPSHFDVYPGIVTESILQNRPILISKNVGWVDDFKNHGIKHWICDFNKLDVVINRIKQVSKEKVPLSLYNQILKYNEPDYVFKQYYKIFHQLAKG